MISEYKEIYHKELTCLDLSVRTLNCLKAADIRTLADLVSYDVADMLKFRNFGKKTIQEIIQYINDLGLKFGTLRKEMLEDINQEEEKNNIPMVIDLQIFKDQLDRIEALLQKLTIEEKPIKKELPKYVDINGAAVITSKTPNALRVQISLGNLKSIKKGSRNYFDREYLENWISGENLQQD